MSLKHCNSHIICSLDAETSGTQPYYHDLIHIAIIPLDGCLRPRKDILPLDLKIKPGRPENIDLDALVISRTKLADIMATGLEPHVAADRFDYWFEKLHLPWNKRIMPLGQNVVFDLNFIKDWLGNKNYEAKFDGVYRDTMVIATYLNDVADFVNMPYPFQKVSLGYLCNAFGIERERSHDAVADAHVTSQVYQQMMRKSMPTYQEHQIQSLKTAMQSIAKITDSPEIKALAEKALAECKV